MIFGVKGLTQLKPFSFAVILAMLIPVLSPAADSPAPAQTATPQPGNVLTLDEAIQIASRFPGSDWGTVEVRPVFDPNAELTEPVDQRLAAALRRSSQVVTSA